MIAVKTTFDGQQIQVPSELQGANPGDVVVIYDEAKLTNSALGRPSIWDVFGKAAQPRTREDIDEQIRQERAAWDDR
jgi:hypothetical protein